MSSPDLAAEEVLKQLIQQIGPERALVLAREHGNHRVLATHNLPLGPPALLLTSHTVIDHVMTTGQPLVVSDLRRDAELKDRWSVKMMGLCSVLCVPCWGRGGSVEAIIYADHAAAQRNFDEQDLATTAGLAQVLEARLFGNSVPFAFPPAEGSRPKTPMMLAPDATLPEERPPGEQSPAQDHEPLPRDESSGLPALAAPAPGEGPAQAPPEATAPVSPRVAKTPGPPSAAGPGTTSTAAPPSGVRSPVPSGSRSAARASGVTPLAQRALRSPTETKPPPPAPSSARPGKPASRAISASLRCLATLSHAGIPMSRALDVLAAQSEDPQLRQIYASVSIQVRQGKSLSTSLSGFPQAFPGFVLNLVRVGEATGVLPLTLDKLADHAERTGRLRMKLKSALTYPAFLMAACLAMMLIFPPLVLQGQLRLLQESGAPLPWATQAVIALSTALRTPWVDAAALVTLALAGGVGVWVWRQRTWRKFILRRLLGLPGLGRAMTLSITVQFAQALAVQLQAGIPITQALPLAAEAPLLEDDAGRAVEALCQGLTVCEALALFSALPRAFVLTVGAGEESGTTPRALGFSAELYELELDAALTSYVGMVEPLIMAVMGAVVAFLLLTTMLPMVHLVQNL